MDESKPKDQEQPSMRASIRTNLPKSATPGIKLENNCKDLERNGKAMHLQQKWAPCSRRGEHHNVIV